LSAPVRILPRCYFVFVETDTRHALYQQNAETGSLEPWWFDSEASASEMLEELAKVEKTGGGRPLNREWLDIVGLDVDNFAKYCEWNWPLDRENRP
jgi:hypothetical protein